MSRLGIGKRMKEHSFLRRREGIQILDTAALGEGAINRLEIKTLWRKLERSDCGCRIHARVLITQVRQGGARQLGDARVPE